MFFMRSDNTFSSLDIYLKLSIFSKHQEKRFCLEVVNEYLLFNEDNLLTANNSGLWSEASLDRSSDVSPCVKYMEMVICNQT